jgi:hypothetical protein
MDKREKTDYCDACFSPWYPRLIDADGEPMQNVCDDCKDVIDDEPAGLREDDERPPICSCGVTMIAAEDEDGDIVFYCANEECPYYEEV